MKDLIDILREAVDEDLLAVVENKPVINAFATVLGAEKVVLAR